MSFKINFIIMKKIENILRFGFGICMITIAIVLSSCQKEKKTIIGAWELQNSNSEIWTFKGDNTFLITYRSGRIEGSYSIENNSLIMNGEGEDLGLGNAYPYYIEDYYANFAIYFSEDKNTMTLSGTEQYVQNFYTINYTDDHCAAGSATLRRVK